MFQLEILFTIVTGVLSLVLVVFGVRNLIKSQDIIGSAVDIGLAVLIFSLFWDRASALIRGFACVANPTMGALKWGVASIVLAWLVWDACRGKGNGRKGAAQ